MQARLKNQIVERYNDAPEWIKVPALWGETMLQHPNREEFIDIISIYTVVMDAKTILFPAQQAEVFAELSSDYSERLDYALPFDQTLIEFEYPIKMHDRELLGIGVSFDIFDKDDFETYFKKNRITIEYPVYGLPADDLPEHAELHRAFGIFRNGKCTRAEWDVRDRSTFFVNEKTEDATIKNLAIACVAYINCENVTLSKVVADPTINAKRKSKGKRQIEDYYICRIRGVQYESDPVDKTDRHVSFRFDVRGHFRRLEDGRMTWVRAHQRGVKNEIYRPKIYKAE